MVRFEAAWTLPFATVAFHASAPLLHSDTGEPERLVAPSQTVSEPADMGACQFVTLKKSAALPRITPSVRATRVVVLLEYENADEIEAPLVMSGRNVPARFAALASVVQSACAPAKPAVPGVNVPVVTNSRLAPLGGGGGRTIAE